MFWGCKSGLRATLNAFELWKNVTRSHKKSLVVISKSGQSDHVNPPHRIRSTMSDIFQVSPESVQIHRFWSGFNISKYLRRFLIFFSVLGNTPIKLVFAVCNGGFSFETWVGFSRKFLDLESIKVLQVSRETCCANHSYTGASCLIWKSNFKYIKILWMRWISN